MYILLSLFYGLNGYAQETYTGTKGSKLFPGHLHAFITVDSSSVKYELFNHWYNASYAQYREMSIPINQLGELRIEKDSLVITIHNGKVKLNDKKYKIKKTIKHQKSCAALTTMRKISYANTLAEKVEDLRHFDLYEQTDLKLSETEFKALVRHNLDEIIKGRD
jgi:hypothetical protein